MKMNNVIKSVICTGIASMSTIIVLTSIENNNVQPISPLMATSKSFTFNQAIGNSYWSDNRVDEKEINEETSEHSSIQAKAYTVAVEDETFYGDSESNSFLKYQHAINGKYQREFHLAVGVNNLTSLSFNFHTVFDANYFAKTDIGYSLNIKFYDSDFNFGTFYNNHAVTGTLLDTIENRTNECDTNTQYNISWD